MQDGISMLKNLEVLEIVGARSLRLEPGIGRLAKLEVTGAELLRVRLSFANLIAHDDPRPE